MLHVSLISQTKPSNLVRSQGPITGHIPEPMGTPGSPAHQTPLRMIIGWTPSDEGHSASYPAITTLGTARRDGFSFVHVRNSTGTTCGQPPQSGETYTYTREQNSLQPATPRPQLRTNLRQQHRHSLVDGHSQRQSSPTGDLISDRTTISEHADYPQHTFGG